MLFFLKNILKFKKKSNNNVEEIEQQWLKLNNNEFNKWFVCNIDRLKNAKN